ncbi:MAG: protein translocase SEC61 complex subunit gamma [Candidatus Pacearchaeota archaeon]
MLNKIKDFFIQCKRVWIVTRKPEKHEINLISKVSAIGIIIIGILGFIISLIIELILKLK